MTNQNIIRLLSGLAFLIFFCPFFQMCSDGVMHKIEEPAAEVIADTTAVRKTLSEKNQKVIPLKEENLTENENGYTLNGYQLASVNFRKIDKLNLGDIFDRVFDFFSLYTLMVLLSIIIFISSLRKKLKPVFWLSVINLLSSIISMLILLSDPTTEISQIKFGYYLFIINTIALIIFSRKIRSKNAI